MRDPYVVEKEKLSILMKKLMDKYKIALKPGNEKEILFTINNGLEQFLKNTIEGLIKVSRSKNINLNMYNKLTEKNPVIIQNYTRLLITQVLKINTYNLEKTNQKTNPEYHFYKEFGVCFTQNTKSVISRLEKFEELNNCKIKYEKISNIKNKIVEIAAMKEKDKEKTQTSTNNIVANKTKLRKVYKDLFNYREIVIW